MNRLEKGLIQIYTGNGKGKTTAVFGLAVRAIGHGFNVFIIQFMKPSDNSEIRAFESRVPECGIETYGRTGYENKEQFNSEDLNEAIMALKRARELIFSGQWDIVILDEIIHMVGLGLIEEKEIISILEEKPAHVEVVLTGRNASEELIKRADLVTEMVQKES